MKVFLTYLTFLFFMQALSAQNNLPIKVERTISFKTNEGSYMDVDISPDGKRIAFTLLGDIYTMPVTGGVAKQITRGLAIKSGPVWSANGGKIIYRSDATGFIKRHIMDASGEHDRIADSMEIKANSPWDPAQEEARLFRRTHPEFTENIFQPWLSPHKQFIAYITTDLIKSVDSLKLLDLKTGQVRLLDSWKLNFALIGHPNFSFSYDSKFFFYSYGGKIHRLTLESGVKQIIPFTANVKADLGKLNYNTYPVSLDSLAVNHIRNVQRSQDGKQIVFCALSRIYTMNLPGGVAKILTAQTAGQFQPAYSPDGKRIIYVSWTDTAGGHIWSVSSQGGIPEQITGEAGVYMHPSWSPDGTQIVFARADNQSFRSKDDPGKGQIQVISLKDRSIKIIADSVSLYNNPVFSSTGNEVLFRPYNDGESEVWSQIVSTDLKSNARTVVAITRKSKKVQDDLVRFMTGRRPFRQVLLSPDGKYLVFWYYENLYLARIENSTTPQLLLDYDNPVQLIRFARGAIDPIWENGGKLLSWVQANKFYSINPDKIIEAASHLQPNKTAAGFIETKIIDVDIPSEQRLAIDLAVPRLRGNGIIALKNARIITMHGKDVIENGTIIIKDGRFVSIGKAGKIIIPDKATIFDLSGKTVIPGLIDMHSHLGGGTVPPDVLSQQSWKQLALLSYGVTTMRDPAGSFDSFGYSELIETGQATGPRFFDVGSGVRSDYTLNSIHEANVIATNRALLGTVSVKQYAQPTRLQRQFLLLACEQQKLNMTNEVEKVPLYCLGMYKDGTAGIEHNPEWGEVYNDVIKFVSKTGTYLCPTLQACYGTKEMADHYFRYYYGNDYVKKSSRFLADYVEKSIAQNLKEYTPDSGFLAQSKVDSRIIHHGGNIVMGSHGNDIGVGAHWEIWALQMGGLTNIEALQTATITAAKGLGMQKDIGSIEVGKIADILILDKNPLVDIHNTNTVKYVMKAGVLYESETLDEIWPEKKKCPEWRMNPKKTPD